MALFSSTDKLRDQIVNEMTDCTAYEREMASLAIDSFVAALTSDPAARSALLAIITKRHLVVQDLPEVIGRLSPLPPSEI